LILWLYSKAYTEIPLAYFTEDGPQGVLGLRRKPRLDVLLVTLPDMLRGGTSWQIPEEVGYSSGFLGLCHLLRRVDVTDELDKTLEGIPI